MNSQQSSPYICPSHTFSKNVSGLSLSSISDAHMTVFTLTGTFLVIKRFFTGKRNKIMKEQSQVYFYIHPDRFSTYLKELMISPHIAYVQFRVVKIKTADNEYTGPDYTLNPAWRKP